MPKFNDRQKEIAETLDGMIVVDAGPGTGKTHTIVQRYVNLIDKGVKPKDILMLTFTRNAASEMEERIKKVLTPVEDKKKDEKEEKDSEKSEEEKREKLEKAKEMRSISKQVQVRTFDAFCLSIVMDSPEDAGRLFGIDAKLTHSARLVENETLNRRFFAAFLDDFLDKYGKKYGDWGIIGSKYPLDMYGIINRLMSRGIYPREKGWFGGNNGNDLYGDTQALRKKLASYNIADGSKPSSLASKYNDILGSMNDYDALPSLQEQTVLSEPIIRNVAEEDRSGLLDFIHDVYWHYIERSIVQDHLTFGINAMLAFSILYMNPNVRTINSFDYIMIDEFQDTNASQLMLALMILKKPNLCVVGDWKQGIYGFRFVSVENILQFEKRAVMLRQILNDDMERVPFLIPEPVSLELDTNYRSSQIVIDKSFDCLKLKGSNYDALDLDDIESHLVRLSSGHGDMIGDDTRVRYVKAESTDAETDMVSRCIRDYIGSGKYRVVESDGTSRPMMLKDVAVLCRTGSGCRRVVEKLTSDGISAYLQGDVELMCTREGKLALAWLRYVNNSRDPWGYIPIMTDLGYTMAECAKAKKSDKDIPSDIRIQRNNLYAKRRRVTELLTSIFSWHGIDNDISQTIINVLSSQHRGSLLTVSDLITMMEDDISSESTYPVEIDLESDAVRIMTMHRAKGLEFPAVIIPYVDTNTMPSTQRDRSKITFDELRGIRSKNVVGHFDGYSKICKSWRTALTESVMESDYDEERRLMFVAVSRAKQYVTVIAGPKASRFMKDLSEGNYTDIEDVELPEVSADALTIEKPVIPAYKPKPQSCSVHGIMKLNFEDGQGGMVETDEICGKGKEYGTAVHEEAQMMEHGVAPSGKYPETDFIAESILSRRGMPGFLKSYSEMACTLPVCGGKYTLRGTIDLLMVFEDRIEVHDYKTDVTDRFKGEYELQLSVYAHVAEAIYKGLPVKCFIDYVSQRKICEFNPWSMEKIDERAEVEVPKKLENQSS